MREIKHYWEIEGFDYILKMKYNEIKDSVHATIKKIHFDQIEVKELNDMEIRNLISLYKKAKFGGN